MRRVFDLTFNFVLDTSIVTRNPRRRTEQKVLTQGHRENSDIM